MQSYTLPETSRKGHWSSNPILLRGCFREGNFGTNKCRSLFGGDQQKKAIGLHHLFLELCFLKTLVVDIVRD